MIALGTHTVSTVGIFLGALQVELVIAAAVAVRLVIGATGPRSRQ